MSRTNISESDVRVKIFQLHNSTDEDSLNAFLAGKTVRHWEAKFIPGAAVSATEGAPLAPGVWNIFVAYQERMVEAPAQIPTNQRQAPVIKKQSHLAVGMTHAERADKTAEARKPVEAYKPHVPEKDMPLFESIRTWRNSRAREERVKPFSFFNNYQLEQIVLTKPADSDALKAIATNMEPPLWEKYHRELLGFIDAARSAMPGTESNKSMLETADTAPAETENAGV